MVSCRTMGLLAAAAAYFFYLIAGCAFIAAIVAQLFYFGKVSRILPADFYRSPRQLEGVLVFAAFSLIGFSTLIIGRSIDLGHLPF